MFVKRGHNSGAPLLALPVSSVVTNHNQADAFDGDDHLRVTLALPMSPVVEKRTPSLVTAISTVSPMVDRSLHGPILLSDLSKRRVCMHLSPYSKYHKGHMSFTALTLPAIACRAGVPEKTACSAGQLTIGLSFTASKLQDLHLPFQGYREGTGREVCAHLQMRANSEEGILMVAAYSVSGMPSLPCTAAQNSCRDKALEVLCSTPQQCKRQTQSCHGEALELLCLIPEQCKQQRRSCHDEALEMLC